MTIRMAAPAMTSGSLRRSGRADEMTRFTGWTPLKLRCTTTPGRVASANLGQAAYQPASHALGVGELAMLERSRWGAAWSSARLG
jgi:hypothetical protein